MQQTDAKHRSDPAALRNCPRLQLPVLGPVNQGARLRTQASACTLDTEMTSMPPAHHLGIPECVWPRGRRMAGIWPHEVSDESRKTYLICGHDGSVVSVQQIMSYGTIPQAEDKCPAQASPGAQGDKDCILPADFRSFPILDPRQPVSVSISSPQGPGQRRGLIRQLVLAFRKSQITPQFFYR
ncbi:hypothetical protein E5288_WYG004764 [Bos mutus]|uniref:Uncharacterized protein n=1 Tax=Bos mutus TaxID=72004 RepID=A0A6B0QVV9_9CETA|nr:hypothetical protein [Bos mutus]